ncbi:hypothetical protein BJ741DRAFT_53649 [Chytriomyces cf. hyalinus JEL632]|nr:hypothetical protein BJ741DRAFT_53649 [Chytriomyces cf. hyalinus JEL632]
MGDTRYYLDSSFDAQRATIAELKAILVREGVAMPGGRLLKDEYVALFRGFRQNIHMHMPPLAPAAEAENAQLAADNNDTENEPQRVSIDSLIKRFDAPFSQEKLVEFGSSAFNAKFGFAHRTLIEPQKLGKRPERLKRSGPLPLPAPPLNPQQHLRSLQSAAHRPDFVVPVAPPPCVSQTGLSPPTSLIDRKLRYRATPSPNKRSPSTRGSSGLSPAGSSPLGLRSSGPSRIPRSKAVTAGVALRPICNAPFTPRVPPSPKENTRSEFAEHENDAATAANVVENDENAHSDSANADENKNTATPSKIAPFMDPDFKRKYNLEDTFIESEDDSDDESSDPRYDRDASPKRRKSMNLGLEMTPPRNLLDSLNEIDVGTTPKKNDASVLHGTHDPFNSSVLKHDREDDSRFENGTAEAAENDNLDVKKHRPERELTDLPQAKASVHFEGSAKKLMNQILEDDAVSGANAIEDDSLVCDPELTEDENSVADTVTNDGETAKTEHVSAIKKISAFRIAIGHFGRILAAVVILPSLYAMVYWWIEVGSQIEYCSGNTSTMPVTKWVPFSPESKRGFAIDIWGQVMPACVPCPDGASCKGIEVTSCSLSGYQVMGDEGFGPLGAYIGLGPVCIKKDDTSDSTKTDLHVNPRIRGFSLPLGARVTLWREKTFQGTEYADAAKNVQNFVGGMGSAVWDVCLKGVEVCDWGIAQMSSFKGAGELMQAGTSATSRGVDVAHRLFDWSIERMTQYVTEVMNAI